MPYRLKPGQESIQIVDGPMAGRNFVRGRVYAEIPPEEKHRFESIRQAPAPKKRPAAPVPEAATAE